jgi:hypothetical protein
VNVRVVDETDFGFGWIEATAYGRTSHALAADGRVWVLDPFEADGVDEKIRALGEPAGVVLLLDRHRRDGEAFAARLGAPLLDVPERLDGAPFELLPVRRNRFWNEVALWWPERRLLACGDVLGTVPFFRAGGEPVGVHPFLRLRPPRALRGLGVERLWLGHGEGLNGPETAAVVEDALAHARRRLPRWLAGLPRVLRRGY